MFDDYTRLTEGQACPVSFIESIEAEQISLSNADTPKPFLISFFIEQCQHCRKAIQFIESQIWPSAENRMKIILIGRNHNTDELIRLQKKEGWSFPLAADPGRSIYNQFAEKKIPRAYLFNANGALVHQVRGYNEEEYIALKELVLELIEDSETSC